MLGLFIRYRGPQGVRAASKGNVLRFARNHNRKNPSGLVGKIYTSLSEQTVAVAATATIKMVVPRVTAQIEELKSQRRSCPPKWRSSSMFSIASMPRFGIKTAAAVLLAIEDGYGFPDAAHLEAYVGIAPTSRNSRTSIRWEHPSRTGNKIFKNALFRSARIANCHGPFFMAYHQQKKLTERDTMRQSGACPRATSTCSIQCSRTGLSNKPRPPLGA